MVISSLAEVASIGALIPFLTFLVNPQKLSSLNFVEPVIIFFKITEIHKLLLPLVIIFVITALLSGAIRLLVLLSQTRLGYSIGADFSNQIYRKTLHQPYSVHVNRNSSKVISVISNKTTIVIESCLLQILLILSSSLILFGITITLILINPVLTFFCIASLGGIYILISIFTKKQLLFNGRIINHESHKVIKALQEGLGGIRDILISGIQTEYCNVYESADRSLRISQANIQMTSRAPRYLVETFGMVLIAAVAYFLSLEADDSFKIVPLLGILAFSAQRILPILQQIYSSWAIIVGCQSLVLEVLFFLEQESNKLSNTTQLLKINFNNKIELSQICFRYSSNSPWVLNNLNIEIVKGSRVGFIGATGSGKSTLLDIITGLIQPNAGSLLIDGIEINEFNSEAWRSNISYVPQNIFLLDGSITDNIAFGVPKSIVDHVAIKNAAMEAQIHDDILSWHEGYETIVGERGVRLSGGQSQRIGIARALYKHSKIIVFDEATSALDPNTEMEVMRAIKLIRKDVTLILVAHRISTLQVCDKVYQVSKGTLVDYNINVIN